MGACYSSVAERVDDSAAQHDPASGGRAFHLSIRKSARRYLQSTKTRTLAAPSSSKLSFLSSLDSFASHGPHHIRSKVNQFDVFSAHRLCEETLAAVGYLALRDVAEKLSLPLETLAAFCEAVDKNMMADGYHSRLHVADVLQLMALQILDDGPLSDVCEDPIIHLSALLAAFVHDLQHPGVTNAFLRATNHEMFQKYGPNSTAEQMHFDSFMALIDDPAFDFLRPLGPQVRSRVINLVEEIVWSTDMARHSEFVSMDEPWVPEAIIVYRLSFAMKVSDLSHCFRNFKVHRKFTGMLKQEFFAQGDKEIALGLPCSYGMNRDERFQDMAEDQVNFLSIFIQPLLVRYADLSASPLVSQLQESLEKNIKSWSVLAVGDCDGTENLDWELPSPVCKGAVLEKQISMLLYCRPRQLMNIAMMHSIDARAFQVAVVSDAIVEDSNAIHESLHTVRLVRDPNVRTFSLQYADKAWTVCSDNKMPNRRCPFYDVSEADEGSICHTADVEILDC